MSNVGWLYANDEHRCEFSKDHPIKSGADPHAVDIRPATAAALLEELLDAWEELRARAIVQKHEAGHEPA